MNTTAKKRGRPRCTVPDPRTTKEIYADRADRRRLNGVKVLENLDKLPDPSRIGVDALLVALDISTTTLWRRIKEGKLPKLGEDGGKRFLTAGQLRAVLAGGQ